MKLGKLEKPGKLQRKRRNWELMEEEEEEELWAFFGLEVSLEVSLGVSLEVQWEFH